MRFLLIVGTVFLIFGAVSLLAVRYDPTAETRAPEHVLILLPDENCITICWHGIELGVSTYEEIDFILHQLPDYMGNSLEDAIDSQYFNGEFSYKNHDYTVGIGIDYQYILLRQRTLTLDDFLLAFGSPDYQHFYETVQSTCPIKDANTFELYYLDKNAVVIVELRKQQQIHGKMMIESIFYHDLLEIQFNSPFYEIWQGFVDLDELAMETIVGSYDCSD